MTGPSALTWRKSRRSGANGGSCVELATFSKGVGVRNSKNPTGGVLHLGPAVWHAFVTDIKHGRYDF